jgi:hypothetical protein
VNIQLHPKNDGFGYESGCHTHTNNPHSKPMFFGYKNFIFNKKCLKTHFFKEIYLFSRLLFKWSNMSIFDFNIDLLIIKSTFIFVALLVPTTPQILKNLSIKACDD